MATQTFNNAKNLNALPVWVLVVYEVPNEKKNYFKFIEYGDLSKKEKLMFKKAKHAHRLAGYDIYTREYEVENKILVNFFYIYDDNKSKLETIYVDYFRKSQYLYKELTPVPMKDKTKKNFGEIFTKLNENKMSEEEILAKKPVWVLIVREKNYEIGGHYRLTRFEDMTDEERERFNKAKPTTRLIDFNTIFYRYDYTKDDDELDYAFYYVSEKNKLPIMQKLEKDYFFDGSFKEYKPPVPMKGETKKHFSDIISSLDEKVVKAFNKRLLIEAKEPKLYPVKVLNIDIIKDKNAHNRAGFTQNIKLLVNGKEWDVIERFSERNNEGRRNHTTLFEISVDSLDEEDRQFYDSEDFNYKQFRYPLHGHDFKDRKIKFYTYGDTYYIPHGRINVNISDVSKQLASLIDFLEKYSDDERIQDVYRVGPETKGHFGEILNKLQESTKKQKEDRPELVDYMRHKNPGGTAFADFFIFDYKGEKYKVVNNFSSGYRIKNPSSTKINKTSLKEPLLIHVSLLKIINGKAVPVLIGKDRHAVMSGGDFYVQFANRELKIKDFMYDMLEYTLMNEKQRNRVKYRLKPKTYKHFGSILSSLEENTDNKDTVIDLDDYIFKNIGYNKLIAAAIYRYLEKSKIPVEEAIVIYYPPRAGAAGAKLPARYYLLTNHTDKILDYTDRIKFYRNLAKHLKKNNIDVPAEIMRAAEGTDSWHLYNPLAKNLGNIYNISDLKAFDPLEGFDMKKKSKEHFGDIIGILDDK